MVSLSNYDKYSMIRMKSFYVYILQCSNSSYYTGVTNDIERRLYEHQEGLIERCYTHNKRPVKLMHIEEFTDIVEAISREKQIKSWTKQKKKALIAGNYQKLVKLSKSHPSTSSG
jgi:putative endonuclease